MAEYFILQDKIELKVVNEAIRNFLGHEPTNEDKKKTSKVEHENYRFKYLLVHDQNIVGMITKRYEGVKYIVEFDPNIQQF